MHGVAIFMFELMLLAFFVAVLLYAFVRFYVEG